MTIYGRLGRAVGPFIVGIGLAALVVNGCASPPQTIEGVVLSTSVRYSSISGLYNAWYSINVQDDKGQIRIWQETFPSAPSTDGYLRVLSDSIRPGMRVVINDASMNSKPPIRIVGDIEKGKCYESNR